GIIPAPLIELALNAEEPSLISPFIRVHGCFLRHHSLSVPCPPSPCARLSRAPTTTRAPPLDPPSPVSAASSGPFPSNGSRFPCSGFDLYPLGGMLWPWRYGTTD